MHTEGIGFLLVLVAIRLAVGLLPRPTAAPRQRRIWLPHVLVTIVGALTASGVASGVLAPPAPGPNEDEPDTNPESRSAQTGTGSQEPADTGPPDRPPRPVNVGKRVAPGISNQSLAHPSARLG